MQDWTKTIKVLKEGMTLDELKELHTLMDGDPENGLLEALTEEIAKQDPEFFVTPPDCPHCKDEGCAACDEEIAQQERVEHKIRQMGGHGSACRCNVCVYGVQEE